MIDYFDRKIVYFVKTFFMNVLDFVKKWICFRLFCFSPTTTKNQGS